MDMAIGLRLYLISSQALKLITWYQSRLRPKVWMLGCGFVVNLGENAIRFVNKRRSQP
jgi:hypothetical protein